MEKIVKELGLIFAGAASGVLLIALYMEMLHGGIISRAVGAFLSGLTGQGAGA